MFAKNKVSQSMIDAVNLVLGEAKIDPVKPDPQAIERKKRLDALRDRQEDERAEKGHSASSSGPRKVGGTAYGGAKQKDEPEEKEHDDHYVKTMTNKMDKALGVTWKKTGYGKNMSVEETECVTKPEVKTIAKGEVKKHEKGMHKEGLSFKDKLLEREMTSAEYKKKEKIVLSMKDNEGYFKKKYGKRWKDVMYATATKKAMGEELNFEESVVEDKKEDLPFTPDKPHKQIATPGKSGYGPSAARHLARLGLKKMLKKEDLEQVTELSKPMLATYIRRASDPGHTKSNVNLASAAADKLAKGGKDDGEKEDRKAYNRSRGIGLAAAKMAREETEQIDEISSISHSSSPDADITTDMLGGRVQGLAKANDFKSWKVKIEGDGVKRPNDKKASRNATPARTSNIAQGGGVNPIAQPAIKVGEEVEIYENINESHSFAPGVESHIQSLGHGKIGFVMDQQKDNLVAVHHQEGRNHHVSIFHKGNLVHQSTHDNFEDASGHAHSALTTKKGIRTHVKEDVELDEGKDPSVDAGCGSEPQFVQNANPSSNPSPKHTVLAKTKEIAKKSFSKMKSEMLGKATGNN